MIARLAKQINLPQNAIVNLFSAKILLTCSETAHREKTTDDTDFLLLFFNCMPFVRRGMLTPDN